MPSSPCRANGPLLEMGNRAPRPMCRGPKPSPRQAAASVFRFLVPLLFLGGLLWTMGASATALAFVPSPETGGVQGPPQRVNPADRVQDAAMSASSRAWQDFIAQHGPWFARWDLQTHTLHRAYGMGIPLCREALEQPLPNQPAWGCILDFLAANQALVGVPTSELVPRNLVRARQTVYASLTRVVEGVPVTGGQVLLRFKYGNLVLVGFDTYPELSGATVSTVPRLTAPEALERALQAIGAPLQVMEPGRLEILPQEVAGKLNYRLCWVSEVRTAPGQRWVSWVDAHDGSLLHQYNRIPHQTSGTLRLEHEIRYPGDVLTVSDAPFLQLESSTGSSVVTDEAGGWTVAGSAPMTLLARMQGPYIHLSDNGASPSTLTVDLAAGAEPTLLWQEGGGTKLEELDAVAHFYEVRAWLEARVPDSGWLPEQVPITVNGSEESCNAYWDFGEIIFMKASGQCRNFAASADVMYHEYGHGIHYHQLRDGVFDYPISEGSADFVVATLLDSPIIGDELFGPDTYLRELETDRVYPDDVTGDSHQDGLIWAGAFWDLREALQAEDGEAGVWTADMLLLEALEAGPTLDDGYEAVILADDDDGDLSNGTPNICLINQVFGAHGLGPGALGLFELVYTPLENQSSAAEGYPIAVSIENQSPQCASFDLATLEVVYSDQSGQVQRLPLEPEGDRYGTVLPRQPSGALISYYFRLSDASGADVWESDGGRKDYRDSFYVGDLEAVYCTAAEGDDGWSHALEGANGWPGQDDWARGTPLGYTNDPDGAHGGAGVWGTNLGYIREDGLGEGAYAHDQRQALYAPELDLTGRSRPLLEYQRWLQVEDARYDYAYIVANDIQLWRNLSTSAGISHHMDGRWTRHQLELEAAMDGSGTLQLEFGLYSDPGLEFGGWNLDDLCILAPTNLGGWYQVGDLEGVVSPSAEQTATLSLGWTNPWATPLAEVRVVRRLDRFPSGPEDGDVVYQAVSPSPGAVETLVDGSAQEGTTYYYAVFAADEGQWWLEVVEGANAISVRVVLEEASSPTPEEGTSTPEGDGLEATGVPGVTRTPEGWWTPGVGATPEEGITPDGVDTPGDVGTPDAGSTPAGAATPEEEGTPPDGETSPTRTPDSDGTLGPDSDASPSPWMGSPTPGELTPSVSSEPPDGATLEPWLESPEPSLGDEPDAGDEAGGCSCSQRRPGGGSFGAGMVVLWLVGWVGRRRWGIGSAGRRGA